MPLADPGYVSDVGAGGAIDPDWGNAIRDRVVHHFASAAARDAAIVSPKEGQACWLADVDQLVIYNGVNWRKPWSEAWGEQASASISTPTQTIGAGPTDVTGLSVTFAQVQNRRYRYECHIEFQDTGAGNVVFLLTDATPTTKARWVMGTNASGVYTAQLVWRETAAATGSVTRKIRATQVTSLTIRNTTETSFLAVDDVGQAGAPA